MTKSDRRDLKRWESTVALAAAAARSSAGLDLLASPVRVELVFLLRRAGGHSGARALRPSAPHHHTTKPDLDKLALAILDGLTSVLWTDDAQVVEIHARKLYALGPLGASVTVETAR